MSALDVVHLVTALMAVAAGLLALWRLARGPSLLDRTIANDVLTAVGVGMVGVMIVGWARDDLSVLLVILALTAFISAVVISRFAVRERADVRRILTQEEADRQQAARERAAREADEADAEDAALEAELPDSADAGADDPEGLSGADADRGAGPDPLVDSGPDGRSGPDGGSGSDPSSAGSGPAEVPTPREEPS